MAMDVEAIRQRIRIEDVVADTGGRLRGGRGPCPICGTSKGSVSFSVHKDRFRCFRCGNYGDVIQLLALLSGSTWKETAAKLCEEHGIKAVAKREKRVDPQEEIGKLFRDIADLRDVLHRVSLSTAYPPADRADAAMGMVVCNETLDFILENLPCR